MLKCRPQVPICQLWCTGERSMQEHRADNWSGKTFIFATKIYQGWRINALIWMTQKLNLSPLLLTSCHLTSQRRLRTPISPSSNGSTQWMQRTHQWVGDNTRLELGSTRNTEVPLARGSSLLSSQQLLLTAVYTSFSTPWLVSHERREKPQNCLQTGQEVEGGSFCGVSNQAFCKRNSH